MRGFAAMTHRATMGGMHLYVRSCGTNVSSWWRKQTDVGQA